MWTKQKKCYERPENSLKFTLLTSHAKCDGESLWFCKRKIGKLRRSLRFQGVGVEHIGAYTKLTFGRNGHYFVFIKYLHSGTSPQFFVYIIIPKGSIVYILFSRKCLVPPLKAWESCLRALVLGRVKVGAYFEREISSFNFCFFPVCSSQTVEGEMGAYRRSLRRSVLINICIAAPPGKSKLSTV